jgi:hypothetical protein
MEEKRPPCPISSRLLVATSLFIEFFQKLYRGRLKERVRVREEEIDWCVYRVIADGDAKTRSEIDTCTRFTPPVVDCSLRRLIRAGLIGQTDDLFRVLPLQQMLLSCQIREDRNSPIYLENGIIKVKKDRESTI